MPLPGKQLRYLRSLGNPLPSKVSVGKQGIDHSLHKIAQELLEKDELVKFRISKNCEQERKQLATQLAENLSAHLVEVKGHTFLLYRENFEDKKIFLPN